MSDQARQRRWFRFSLRTLFVLVTLCAFAAWLGPPSFRWVHDRLYPPKPTFTRANVQKWMAIGSRVLDSTRDDDRRASAAQFDSMVEALKERLDTVNSEVERNMRQQDASQ